MSDWALEQALVLSRRVSTDSQVSERLCLACSPCEGTDIGVMKFRSTLVRGRSCYARVCFHCLRTDAEAVNFLSICVL